MLFKTINYSYIFRALFKINDECYFSFGFEKEKFNFVNFDKQNIQIKLHTSYKPVVLMKWQKNSLDDTFSQSLFYNATEYKLSSPCLPAKIIRSIIYVDLFINPSNPNCGLTIEMVNILILKIFSQI